MEPPRTPPVSPVPELLLPPPAALRARSPRRKGGKYAKYAARVAQAGAAYRPFELRPRVPAAG